MITGSVAFRKKLDRIFLTWSLRFLRCLAAATPYRLGIWCGAGLGLAAYYLLPRERSRTYVHLSFVYGDDNPARVRRIARACFVHLGRSLFEVLLVNPRRLRRMVTIQGGESLRSALSAGKGVVVVTGHIGNWELLAHAVADQYPVSVVAAPLEPPAVNDMIVRLRGGMGVKTILRGRPGASRELIRVFKENRILGILIDQDTDVESAFVDFMGKPARTPTAAASMAIKFGAPVLFGYIHRGRDGRHTIRFDGPLELVRTGDDEKDIVSNTAMLTKRIEDCIRGNPEQWVWMHRRWRRQP